MILKKIIKLIYFFILSLIIIQPSFAQQGGVIIYSNSFESPQDTIGWSGYGMINFNSDVPPDGGNQSLYISGGCFVPHAQIELGPFYKDGYYILQCWGKDLQIGGAVSINVMDSISNQVNVVVNNKEWTHYESAETLFCSSGNKIVLSIIAGGFIPSAILVDLIEIVKVSHPTSVAKNNDKNRTHTFELLQNYPNPFNPSTTISYQLSTVSKVSLKVYDVLGREVAALVNEVQSAGEHSTQFEVGNRQIPSGVYFYQLKSGEYISTKKMIILK
ncbi:MAG: T9SS type A sorting domain-containing protein [Bacteroidetes bacterium]|nr:T9SS type A sorting domain-containing protein [Bacteroidota bacterium]